MLKTANYRVQLPIWLSVQTEAILDHVLLWGEVYDPDLHRANAPGVPYCRCLDGGPKFLGILNEAV